MKKISLLGYKISLYLFIILIILLLLTLYRLIVFSLFTIFSKYNITFYKSNNNSDSTILLIDLILPWISYFILFCIIFYINISQTKNFSYKVIFSIIIILLIILPVFPIINIINLFLILACNNPPFIKNLDAYFPENKLFENNYIDIKNEIINYNNNYKISCFRNNIKINFLLNIDTYNEAQDYCWRTLYLKTSGKIHKELEKYFPNTIKLLQNPQIDNAFFSILDPSVEIKPHVGYYKGYLRYHLGITIPEENGKKPYIVCGGEKYEWIEGKGVIFDDMFIHYVNNPTNKQRIVLYLDIKRNNLSDFQNYIVSLGNSYISNSYVNTVIKNQHIQTKI